MPKGVYCRDGDVRSVWSDEQDEWLASRCLTNASYGAIAIAFNVAFPNDRKTRSAIMGRASRRGFADNKPHADRHYGTKGTKRSNPQPSARKIKTKRKPDPIVVEAPVIFGEGEQIMLREEGALAKTYRYGRKSATQIEEAKRGFLPSIIENAPLTAVLLSDCPDNGCKWPTCDDPFMVCGSPATLGSYCSRHGNVAFRELPTAKRNANYHRRGSSPTGHDRELLIDDEVQSPGISPEGGDVLRALLRDDSEE